MRMSDPKHFDHILPFLQPADVHHAIPLSHRSRGSSHAYQGRRPSGCGRLRAAA
jgi:hypothetical protein